MCWTISSAAGFARARLGPLNSRCRTGKSRVLIDRRRTNGRREKTGRRTATVAAYQRRCVAASVSSMSASETGQRAASRWYPKKGVGGIERRSLLLAADHPTAQGGARGGRRTPSEATQPPVAANESLMTCVAVSMCMGKRPVARLADGRWPIGAAVGSLKRVRSIRWSRRLGPASLDDQLKQSSKSPRPIRSGKVA